MKKATTLDAGASKRGDGLEPSLLGPEDHGARSVPGHKVPKYSVGLGHQSKPTAEVKNCTGPDETKLHHIDSRVLMITLSFPAEPGPKRQISFQIQISMKREKEKL